MKSLTKQFLLVLVLVLTVSAAFAGGGGQKATPGQGGSGGNAINMNAPLAGEIRFSWWGNEVRNNATIQAIEYFQSKNPGTRILPEYTSFDGYNNKLMAFLAAGNAPDIFTMNAEWLPSVVGVNGLTDLTGLVDVSSHNPEVTKACSINGRMYAVNLSLNANVLYYNKTLADELDIKVPEDGMTWEQFINICSQVYQKTGKKTYGMPDQRMKNALETFLPAWTMTYLGEKSPPYPWTDTELLITEQDVVTFMDYWNKAPEGVLLPPEETALIDTNNAPIAARKTFFQFEYSGSFSQNQSQTRDSLVMIEYPDNKKGKGHAVSARPGVPEGVYSGSKNKVLAIKFLEWLANDGEAIKYLTNTRGVPNSSTQREVLLANPQLLSDMDVKVNAIVNKVFAKEVNPFSPGPTGVSTLFSETYMRSVGAEVAFKRITPQEAGKRFTEMVKDTIGK
jgi:multiple sugar transport system substrate-binding protein